MAVIGPEALLYSLETMSRTTKGEITLEISILGFTAVHLGQITSHKIERIYKGIGD